MSGKIGLVGPIINTDLDVCFGGKVVGIIDGEKEDERVKITKHGSFSQTYDECPSSMAFIKQNDKIIHIDCVRWDTGSNHTYMDVSEAKSFIQDPDSNSVVSGVDGMQRKSNDYDVTIVLPGGIELSHVSAGDLDLSSLRPIKAIIGMDVISQGKFVIKKDRFSFSI